MAARPRPDAEVIQKSLDMNIDYYSRVSSWQEALYIDNDPGTEVVLPEVQEAIDSVHPEIQQHYMGCGPMSLNLVDGLKMLDLGNGYGRDTFAYSKLIGPNGYIIGCDITDKESDFARKRIEWHREKYGYEKANIEFRQASMTDLKEAQIGDSTIDAIISNGAVCMVPDTEAVYAEVSRTLKDGGEFHYYSVFADRRVTYDVFNDSDLTGHGLGCAYWKDQVEGLRERGMSTPRIVDYVKAWSKGEKALKVVAGVKYMYIAYRTFKLPSNITKEPCTVTYTGSVPNCQESLKFDYFTTFKTGTATVVDGELAAILKSSRYAPHFSFSAAGDSDQPQTKDPMIDPFTLIS